VTVVSHLTNAFTVSVPSGHGRVYQLVWANSLTNPFGGGLPLQAGQGGPLRLTDPLPAGPARYYQVKQW